MDKTVAELMTEWLPTILCVTATMLYVSLDDVLNRRIANGDK